MPGTPISRLARWQEKRGQEPFLLAGMVPRVAQRGRNGVRREKRGQEPFLGGGLFWGCFGSMFSSLRMAGGWLRLGALAGSALSRRGETGSGTVFTRWHVSWSCPARCRAFAGNANLPIGAMAECVGRANREIGVPREFRRMVAAGGAPSAVFAFGFPGAPGCQARPWGPTSPSRETGFEDCVAWKERSPWSAASSRRFHTSRSDDDHG